MELIRVLLVEDDPAARVLVGNFLGAVEGVELCGCAGDGLEGLELIRVARPDAVLLDLVMPGLDGLGVLRRLNERPPPRMPEIVVVSRIAHRGIVEAALELGASYYLIKPVNLEALPLVLRSLCGGGAERAAACLLAEMGAAGAGARAAAGAAAALSRDRTGNMLLKQAYAAAIRAQGTSYQCVEKNIRDMVRRLHEKAAPEYRALMAGVSGRPSNEVFLRRLASAAARRQRREMDL